MLKKIVIMVKGDNLWNSTSLLQVKFIFVWSENIYFPPSWPDTYKIWIMIWISAIPNEFGISFIKMLCSILSVFQIRQKTKKHFNVFIFELFNNSTCHFDSKLMPHLYYHKLWLVCRFEMASSLDLLTL